MISRERQQTVIENLKAARAVLRELELRGSELQQRQAQRHVRQLNSQLGLVVASKPAGRRG